MSEQLPLFGVPAPVPLVSGGIKPALPSAAIVALGAKLPANVYLGTSSWSFPGWAGIVYAERAPETQLARLGLAAYSAHPVLRAVGIDRTFYAPVPAAAFAAYAKQVPAGFRFLVKAPARVTDAWVRGERGKIAGPNVRFLDAACAIDEFVGPCLEGLGAKAGPLVFQFSPLGHALADQPARFAELLYTFLAALPRGPLYAVELRDRELLGDALAQALASTGSRYCIGVHARMPRVAVQAAAMAALGPGPMIARWSLHAGFAYEEAKAEYAPFNRLIDEDPDSRASLAALIGAAIAAAQPAFVIANNKAEGSAPLSLVKLAENVVRA